MKGSDASKQMKRRDEESEVLAGNSTRESKEEEETEVEEIPKEKARE